MQGSPVTIVRVSPDDVTMITSPSAVEANTPLPSGALQRSMTPPDIFSVSNCQSAPLGDLNIALFDRPAQPAELAAVFVLLASPEAGYITGEVYGVTGGRTPY